MERDFLADAREYLERAQGGLDTLHIGPLDYNVFTTCDCLRTAAACIEEYEREVTRSTVSESRGGPEGSEASQSQSTAKPSGTAPNRTTP